MRPGLIWRLARRDWRSGELRLLLASLTVGVATVTAISLFVDRLQQALLLESASFLAADRYVSASEPLPAAYAREAEARQLPHTTTLTFPSMVFAGDRNQLVGVKAVADGYPLRGVLVTGSEAFAPGQPVQDIPAPGEVWLDSRLLPALGVVVGDEVEVGVARLRVARVLVREPDRGGSFFDLGPRLMMNRQDVPATEVVQPGSRINYRLLLRGPQSQLDAFQAATDPDERYRWVDIHRASPRIGVALDRAERYLLLAGLLAVLLAGVAVALSARRYAHRHFDHVGILKTLGAGPNSILTGYLGILAGVGGVAVLLGLALGAVLHLGIVEALEALLPVALPGASIRPFALGAATGMISALAFAMPPLLHLRAVPPARVIRRDMGPAPVSEWVTIAVGGAGALFLLIWYSGSLLLTGWALAGMAGVLLIFGVAAYFLLRIGRVVGMKAGSSWRLALSGLRRRQGENILQIGVFGLALMLLLILTLLRSALVDEWQASLPEDIPNHFLMNVTPAQVQPVSQLLQAHTSRQGVLTPMLRGRVVAVNGEAAADREARQGRQGDGPRLGSERNLTWTADLPSGNDLTAGVWWGADETRPLVSLEAEYAEELRLGLGDRLTFDIAGSAIEAEVASLRALDWESMEPNFFILFSPGVLSGQAVTYMTSFHLPTGEKAFLNRLLSEFPTVTVIEVDAIVAQVQRIVERVTRAVELVLGLVLVSGCLVLIASIQASRDGRLAEHALVRALGGRRRLIRGSLALEFAVLGLFAGLLGVFGAEVTVALLQLQVFDLPPNLHPELWLLAPALGAALVLVVGMVGARGLVSSPPILVLRGLE